MATPASISASASALRRALLYVPASSQKMLTRSLGLVSDNVTYDLEDSVTPHEKPNARQALAKHLSAISSSRPEGIGEIAARINAVSTPYALEDIQALGREPNLEAIVIPKVNAASDLTFVSDALKHVAPHRYNAKDGTPIKLIALIESAQSVLNLSSICAAGVRDGVGLSGLIFAAEDFSLDLSLTRTPSLKEFLYARSAIVTHARAFRLPSIIDLVCTTYRGDEGLRRLEEECIDGKGMGFNGKQCIHPSQVEIVQKTFAPSAEEVEWSVRVVVADEKASKGDRVGEAGRGAWTLSGKMIDAPVVGKAKAVVEKAKRCGFDVEGMRERWKDQKPE
ncbi:Citrate lyase subunit beta-like protein, mitochondrial [Cytospora mali]|uniref:Citrate lyase subunit beta-like protein, mitochondrial n=1 Tax=Cytospora mali TaxID=578113 RepID=A0A194VBL1_CYTMA|nr:Citrate lyase subunit beta-like protein, mitochondrial [Valsa mali var. pyri (nom. inval.)]